MANETPTDPSFPILTTANIVAKAGKQPLPVLLDLNGDGIPDYQQKWFRDTLSGALFKALAAVWPKSPWALLIKQYEAEIQALIDKGAA